MFTVRGSGPDFACAGLGLAIAAGTVINVSSSGGLVFESHWDTAVGISNAAVTDGQRWPHYWEFNNGSGVQLLSVVAGGFNGHNALRVQQRGSSYAANLQIDNFVPPSTDYYVRYYMKNDDTSTAGDHIVTVDTYQYANLTFMRKYSGGAGWQLLGQHAIEQSQRGGKGRSVDVCGAHGQAQ